MHYDKDRDELNLKNARKNVLEAKDDVVASIKLAKYVKYTKIIIAISILMAYIMAPEHLTQLIVLGLILSLLLPQGFMDTYLEKLINLRSSETDERQILNATEANKHFSNAFQKIERLEKK